MQWRGTPHSIATRCRIHAQHCSLFSAGIDTLEKVFVVIDALYSLLQRHTTDHIAKQKPRAMHLFCMQEDTILEHKHLIVHARVKDYRVQLTVGKYTYATCTCTGFYYNHKCTHIHQTILKCIAANALKENRVDNHCNPAKPNHKNVQ